MTETPACPDLYDRTHAVYARLADLCSKLELLAALAQDLPPARLHHLLQRIAAQDRAWLQRQIDATRHGATQR